jgi:hypothetical protein
MGDRIPVASIPTTKSPFSPDLVAALEMRQRDKFRHPFTCPNRGDGKHRENDIDLGALVPTIRGWICPFCEYTQDWTY